MPLLDGHRLLITGVLTDRSIAYAVARRAQEEGAEVVLTGAGRGLRLTSRMAKRLPVEADVLELDVTQPEQVEAVRADLEARWGAVDGVLHAIAFVPPDALGGNGRFLSAPTASAVSALEIGAVSLQTLAASFADLLAASDKSPSLLGLDFDASLAWPAYDWAGVTKAALESINRYLAQELGPRGVRSNLVAAGPINTLAAGAIDGFEDLSKIWETGAPLQWDVADATPVADACLFLLSPWARSVTGEVLHADGGVHAVGAPGAAVRSAGAGASAGEGAPDA